MQQLHQLAFFSTLAGRLEAVKPADLRQCEGAHDPDPETEVVVGDIPPILQALAYVRIKAKVDFRQAEAGIDLIPAAEQAAELSRIVQLRNDAEAMESLFWAALRAEFPELQGNHQRISYYRGWKVGYTKGQDNEDGGGGLGSRLARAFGL